jgi:hypothetical protein
MVKSVFCGCGCAWYSEEGPEARLLWSLASYVANSHNAGRISTNTRATLKEALKRSKSVLSFYVLIRNSFLICNSSSHVPCSFYPTYSLDINTVRIDELRESWARLSFCHSISRVGLSINPLHLHNESPLVGLLKAHNVNHKALLLSGAESNKAVVQGLRVGTEYEGQVNL